MKGNFAMQNLTEEQEKKLQEDAEDFRRLGLDATYALDAMHRALSESPAPIMQAFTKLDAWYKSLVNDQRKQSYLRRYSRRSKKPLS